ncbi:hypothetical protein SAMN05216359_105292 [Roseateles sp. YR242]|uniref:hypothetical protein n=1 Tax=Roseateles sp. YR242 TaxID=1855305 RepID=UPI0008B3FFF2|nr:hypothetical protein [Roseateles sp. YR242]SEL12698.1 hypothetical protein SAMN05216359_105292 [Roseateles sp. YR242]
MKPRFFKKLCKRAAPLCIALDPNLKGIEFVVREKGGHDGWNGAGCGDETAVLKGTPGFGGFSGYYEPEWWDDSAWSMLFDQVYWAVGEFDPNDEECPYPRWPARIDPRDWRQVIAEAERMILANERAPAPGPYV